MSDVKDNESRPSDGRSYGYPPGYYQVTHKQEIDLAAFMKMVWSGKWIIMALSFVFAVGAIVYSLSLPNLYQAQVRLAPSEESQRGAGNMASQFGGLASLAGVQLGGGQTGNAMIAAEILRSRQFLMDFIERREIKPDILAIKRWDPSSGEVVYDTERYSPETGWVSQEPSNWIAVRELRNSLVIDYDDMRGFATIRAEHQSPVVAKNWVDWLVEDINAEIRRQDIAEATKSREYLENELATVSLASMQQVFNQLIEKQVHTIMMANVRPEYVFRVIDPAVVAEEKSSPARALIVIFCTILGGFIGFLIVFVRFILRDSAS